jgi:ribosomal-protein-alanine N-acetyltransferase
MSDLPFLETARLSIRVPTPEDAIAMAVFASDNREHFAPWDPERSDEYFTVENWRKLLEEVVEQARSGVGLQFVLFPRNGEQGSVLGHCTFSGIVRGPFQAAYLGYGLDHRAVGKGLMEEALRATIRYCFSDLNLHRIMANYMPANVRSASLLRRLGFVPEGFARDYLRLAGAWQDHVLTALTNDQWRNA